MGEATNKKVSELLPWHNIRPADVNDEIYSQVDEESDEFQKLAASIRVRGLLEPVHVTRDHVIISGHRRHAAFFVANGSNDTASRAMVPVVIHEDVKSGTDEHTRLLVEANSQRVKTAEMMVREAAVLSDPEKAYEKFKANREKAESDRDEDNFVEDVEWEARKNSRREVSAAKMPMLRAAIKIINENRDYWPLSVRQIHYRLLNDPPLRHAKKPHSRYVNDVKSYKDLCNVLTMARVAGMVPFHTVADETRPTIQSNAWDNLSPFAQNDITQLFQGYRRNLLQDQDDYVMALAEKLTVKTILEKVCRDHCVPLVVCRGYPDIGTRNDIAQRFFRSGKRRLVLLFVNDCDPEGWNIPQTICQTLNEDFGIHWERIVSKRVALTKTDAEDLGLPPNYAKEESARFDAFVEETGSNDSWELEALEPASLAAMMKTAIADCIDCDKFNAQVDIEMAEGQKLLAMAKAAKDFFKGFFKNSD